MADTFRVDRYTATAKKSEIYSDFTTDFTPHPDTGDLVRSVNEDSVKRSMRNLIRTNRYERFFSPAKGSDVEATLFENITPQSQAKLQTGIRNLIENYEPRAKLVSVTVDAFPEKNAYVITLVFYTVNKSEPQTLQLPLYRLR